MQQVSFFYDRHRATVSCSTSIKKKKNNNLCTFFLTVCVFLRCYYYYVRIIQNRDVKKGVFGTVGRGYPRVADELDLIFVTSRSIYITYLSNLKKKTKNFAKPERFLYRDGRNLPRAIFQRMSTTTVSASLYVVGKKEKSPPSNLKMFIYIVRRLFYPHNIMLYEIDTK